MKITFQGIRNAAVVEQDEVLCAYSIDSANCEKTVYVYFRNDKVKRLVMQGSIRETERFMQELAKKQIN